MLLLLSAIVEGTATGAAAATRFSHMHTYHGFCSLPLPDGTVDAANRLLLIGLYSSLIPPADPGGSMTGYIYDRGKTHDAIYKKKLRKKRRHC